MRRLLTLIPAILVLGVLASTALAATHSHRRWVLSTAVAHRAVAAEQASEQLPISYHIVGCRSLSQNVAACGVLYGSATYQNVGQENGPTVTMPWQTSVLIARRVASDRVQVWYAHYWDGSPYVERLR